MSVHFTLGLHLSRAPEKYSRSLALLNFMGKSSTTPRVISRVGLDGRKKHSQRVYIYSCAERLSSASIFQLFEELITERDLNLARSHVNPPTVTVFKTWSMQLCDLASGNIMLLNIEV